MFGSSCGYNLLSFVGGFALSFTAVVFPLLWIADFAERCDCALGLCFLCHVLMARPFLGVFEVFFPFWSLSVTYGSPQASKRYISKVAMCFMYVCPCFPPAVSYFHSVRGVGVSPCTILAFGAGESSRKVLYDLKLARSCLVCVLMSCSICRDLCGNGGVCGVFFCGECFPPLVCPFRPSSCVCDLSLPCVLLFRFLKVALDPVKPTFGEFGTIGKGVGVLMFVLLLCVVCGVVPPCVPSYFALVV